MRKRSLLPLLVLVSGFAVAGCGISDDCDCEDGDDKSEVAVVDEPALVSTEMSSPAGDLSIERGFYYNQITGGGEEIPTLAHVLFEYEQEDRVKYQVAYVACTCRGPSVNYYSVAYVELSKKDGSVMFMSYDQDSGGHYRPGVYGDSKETGDGIQVRKLFDKFRKEHLVGSTQDQIYEIEPMHGNVDVYSGATVTPNNAVTMLHGLFGYHNKRYN